MIRRTNTHKMISRDGTSQEDRYLEALNPEYIAVEGRSMEELIHEAQGLAKEIRFFDEENNVVSNWEALFVEDVEEFNSKSETGKDILRKRWASQLAGYVENPDRFQNDPQKLARLSRPHVVLFMTFLKLLNHVKSQMNGLTRKHLDFYFLDRLGFTPKDAVPDEVNVLLDLTPGVDQLEVKKGTILFAGNDDDGNPLQYTTDRDTVISGATVSQLKTVFVDKATLTIRDAHRNNMDEPDGGFSNMMEIALGAPEIGDPLPAFPSGVGDMLELHTKVLAGDTAALDYVANQLYFSPHDDFKDFKTVMATHVKDLEAKEEVTLKEWESVYAILDEAHKNGIKEKRKLALKAIRESNSEDGLGDLLSHVYGTPEPGDALPLYGGNLATLADLHTDLSASLEGLAFEEQVALKAKQEEAAEYLAEELFLSDKDFVKLYQTSENANATPLEWETVYEILELANRKVRGLSLPSPERKELYNVFAESDAKSAAFSLYGEEGETVRFKTFGGGQLGIDQGLDPANIGFAISSPLLVLREGKRRITTTVVFQPGSGNAEDLTALFDLEENEAPPFRIFYSSADKWVEAKNLGFVFGTIILAGPDGALDGTIEGNVVTKTGTIGFKDDQIGSYLAWGDGTVYEIVEKISEMTVGVKEVGQIRARTQIQIYERSSLLPNALRISLELQDEDLPVVPITTDDQRIYPEFPGLVFSLNHLLVEKQGKQSLRSHYQDLMNLKMERVLLGVEVEGLRDLTLQNDLVNINGKKPFEPFGFAPELGSSFYLTHPELCHKRLDSLKLDVQWMKLPDDFKAHYENYWLIETDNPDLSDTDYKIQSKHDFKSKVLLYDNRAELEIASIGLFPQNGQVAINDIQDQIKAVAPTFQYKSNTSYRLEEDVLDCDRYFKFELDPEDFQHSVFDSLFRKQAISESPKIQKLNINPPYTPKIKSLRAGYSSHTEILLQETGGEDQDGIYHLHPFGYSRVTADSAPYLLPQYQAEGALYLGIDKLLPPQSLSILFQLSEGSADPEVEKAELAWAYLKGSEWVQLTNSAILTDTTNGLLNTGIVQIEIPGDATQGSYLMPGELHWLRITCDDNTAAISDTIAVATQVVSATFSSSQVAESHFVNLLPPESITETLEFTPGIRKITQPYTSSKGKPAEKDTKFYNRISERLRHKNRALNMWDYERMVLEQFPEIYKVKCLPATHEQNNRALGTVNVLVIPEIKGKLPFNPFEPKVPANVIFKVQEFLDRHTPAYADVSVSNPTFLQMMVRCVVKFKEGYNEGFYKPKLIEEIKRFLAPWAYNQEGEITIGGSIYASVIINFIAERPYIEYVANMKLFQSEDGKQFTDVRSLNNGENRVVAMLPDTVLVSAQTHVIDIVDENGYDEDNFEGINYMRVELDFQVGENVLP